MIGHYLLSLTPEQEDRVLTRVMGPGEYYDFSDNVVRGPGCLDQNAIGDWFAASVVLTTAHPAYTRYRIEQRYDGLCLRFGTERTNRVIRNRILSNRLWRTMCRPTFSEHPRCDTPVGV
jgi:hypothetical protein